MCSELANGTQHVHETSARKNNTDQTHSFRDTGVSWHQGGTIEGSPENPRTSQRYRIEVCP